MGESSDKRRLSRVSERIREGIAKALFKNVRDPLLQWVTLTGVKMSADLRHARVYFSIAGDHEPDAVEKSLRKAAPFLQKKLGGIGLRYVPQLSFQYDTSLETGRRVDDLIREVQQEDARISSDDSPSKKLDRLINDADTILVTTHRNPDGDAIGSLLGMGHILKRLGKDTIVYCPDAVPKTMQFLPGSDEVTLELDGLEEFDLTIALDLADASLLPDGFPSEESRGTLVIIDHHCQHDDLGDFIIRQEAAAVGEMLFELAGELLWPLDAAIAECLYTSIVADTGSFRYSSTTAKTHKIAAELLEAGAKPWVVATQLYESFPLRRQRLLGEVLNTLEISEDGRFASLYCTPEMLQKTGSAKEDLDGLINLGRSIENVEIAAMLRVESADTIRVSFRSKGRIDVGELAAQFGGGGHRNAAGCTLQETELKLARQKIKKAVYNYLAEYNPKAFRQPVT